MMRFTTKRIVGKLFHNMICEYCKREFKPKYKKYRQSKYCSIDCYKADWHNAHAEKFEKIAAQKEERQRQAEEAKARKKLLRRMLKALNKREKQMAMTKECEVCGNMFVAKHVTQKYCCDICRHKHDNRAKEKRIYQNGKPDLSISLTRLYMRDMGVCALCGKRIDFDCDSNSNDYPSIDHITPLSKGGLHTWDNVQLACRGCNSKKRDKI